MLIRSAQLLRTRAEGWTILVRLMWASLGQGQPIRVKQGERILNQPGVWAMGDLDDDDRGRGIGIVVEYAGRTGKPDWKKPAPFRWDYTRFGTPGGQPAAPDETIEILVVKHNGAADGFNLWTLNGEAFSMETMKPIYTVHEGRRYRLKFRNASDDVHPLHLHRHSFELVRVGGKPTAGVIRCRDARWLSGSRVRFRGR